MCESCEEDEAFFMAYYAKARAQLPKSVPPAQQGAPAQNLFAAEGFAAAPSRATPSRISPAANPFACEAPPSPDRTRS